MDGWTEDERQMGKEMKPFWNLHINIERNRSVTSNCKLVDCYGRMEREIK